MLERDEEEPVEYAQVSSKAYSSKVRSKVGSKDRQDVEQPAQVGSKAYSAQQVVKCAVVKRKKSLWNTLK